MRVEHVLDAAADDGIGDCRKKSGDDAHDDNDWHYTHETDNHTAQGAETTAYNVHVPAPKCLRPRGK
jgi:hypothetical protein